MSVKDEMEQSGDEIEGLDEATAECWYETSAITQTGH